MTNNNNNNNTWSWIPGSLHCILGFLDHPILEKLQIGVSNQCKHVATEKTLKKLKHSVQKFHPAWITTCCYPKTIATGAVDHLIYLEARKSQ